MSIESERQAVVDEARSWIGTPYHPEAMIKGAGIDCLTLLDQVFENTGLITPIHIPHYSKDWHMHQGCEELYLKGVEQFCTEVDPPPARAPLPGDIILWRFGHAYSHGAIVSNWPMVIHAYTGVGCMEEDAERAQFLLRYYEIRKLRGQLRPRKAFALNCWVR